jgi:membrane protease YdiL (CAAX protease family)
MSELPGSNNLRNPLISILLTLVIVLLGFQLVGPMIGMMIAYPLFPGSHVEFANAMQEPFKHPELKSTILLMQGLGTFFGMIVLPFFILKKQQRSLDQLFSGYMYLRPAIIAAILVVVFMGVNSVVIEWNQNISFPGDEWARQIEKTLAEGTKFLTQFNSAWDLVFVFIIVAILPSIGEEIVFRGMIQNDFYRATKNIHLAIWVSAIMFSAIHVQFFGFFPRLLLGALFGYLYFWSGNLWVAVLAHFVNNGLTVIGLYLNQKGIIDIDLEQTSSTPWQAVLFSAVCTVLLLYAYKSFYNNNPKADIPD